MNMQEFNDAYELSRMFVASGVHSHIGLFKNLKSGERVAIKVPIENTPKKAAMAKREASILQKLAHANIIKQLGTVTETFHQDHPSKYETCYLILE